MGTTSAGHRWAAIAAVLALALAIASFTGRGTARADEPESDGVRAALPVEFETNAELLRLNAFAIARQATDSPVQLGEALKQRARLAAGPSVVPGTNGHWTQYGHGPMIGDDPAYPATMGDGYGKIEGRINDLTWVPQTKKLYAAAAQGGLWESTDVGEHWRAVGRKLPIGSTGAVAWSPAGGGTLLVATGDMAFSNDYAGVGTFWSTDDGDSWHQALGAPEGALSFRLAVDPTNPNVVYLATGVGLFRSTDAGRSFVNVVLPTGACAGNSLKPDCFFANVVTDVAVQATDSLGHRGGAVVAAVGWRAGQHLNFNGKPQAPANGLYRSPTGLPGSFVKVPDSAGFTPTVKAGRIALGATTGPRQNSQYLYAVAQDAQSFSRTVDGGEGDIPLVGTPSVLDAVYVSPDFGATWTLMERREEFYDPTNLSALSQLTVAGIGPGYQTSYNEFVRPDPTRQFVDGTPTRVILGMEEVWSTVPPAVPQRGPTRFQAIGAYTANGGACLALAAQCGAVSTIAPHTTTHPDQHAIAMIPKSDGGVTLVVGNDGGAYTQTVGPLGEFNQLGWGDGANAGFDTLEVYGAAMAKDGTVFGGLQDNGELKILPNGEEHTVYVGDGIFSLVDPDNSKVAYDELPNGGINVTTDGGKTWSSMDPGVIEGDFVAPMVMDPTSAKHILATGRNVAETTAGPATASGDWKSVFDLGTHAHPGDAAAVATDADPSNVGVAAALNGDNAYVGFCGDCDPVKTNRVFHTGFATNVGGSKPPKRGTADGWHIAAGKGLPNRIITSVAVDPANPRVAYVTVGASAARYWAPLGSLGDDTSTVGTGSVFKTTDAGATFTDISGDLPHVQATWSVVHAGQLVVGTAIGVFAAARTTGGHYALLGDGLPPVAVFSLQLKPGDPDLLVAGTFGLGVWTYRFPRVAPPVAAPGAVIPVTGGSSNLLPGLVFLALALLTGRARTKCGSVEVRASGDDAGAAAH
ncbi:MAG TPA: hypothetical protein VHC63_07875 [Acidimicrobiales bacterium]|nr:hypothetical protein [Acidimicrobiales bacterium]